MKRKIEDGDVISLQEHLKSFQGFVSVGIGAKGLIIYASKDKQDFPKTWQGHPVRVVKSSAPRPATT